VGSYSIRIKTTKATRIHNIVEKGLIRSDRLHILVFGSAKSARDYTTHRLAVKRLIERLNQVAEFPEDVKSHNTNVALKEYGMMKDYDYTIIVMTSVGSISEYTLFFRNTAVAHKIRLFVPKRFQRSTSFLSSGLIVAFKKVHKQVYYFSSPKNLLLQVDDMIRSMIVYKKLQNI
jgi:hypothetical protein